MCCCMQANVLFWLFWPTILCTAQDMSHRLSHQVKAEADRSSKVKAKCYDGAVSLSCVHSACNSAYSFIKKKRIWFGSQLAPTKVINENRPGGANKRVYSVSTDLQWLPHSRLQYSLSQSWLWATPGPGPGPGAPGDWEPPMLFWYSDWRWEKPWREERQNQVTVLKALTVPQHEKCISPFVALPAAQEVGSEERPAAPSGERWLAGTGPAACG